MLSLGPYAGNFFRPLRLPPQEARRRLKRSGPPIAKDGVPAVMAHVPLSVLGYRRSEQQERAASVKARSGVPGPLPRVPLWVEEITRAPTPIAVLGSHDLRRTGMARHVKPTVDVLSCRHQDGQRDASKQLQGPRTRRSHLPEGFVQGQECQETA